MPYGPIDVLIKYPTQPQPNRNGEIGGGGAVELVRNRKDLERDFQP